MSLIYLVGPRACGKTTLGKALSEVLDVPYCDTDHHLCERLGMNVATMVERWGWEGFRSRESESLRLASEELAGRGVVATGGGMVLAEANRRYMREHGRVFFLSAPGEVLAARLREVSKTIGANLAPFASWLVLRGIQPLAVRMDRAEEIALALAHWLQ